MNDDHVFLRTEFSSGIFPKNRQILPLPKANLKFAYRQKEKIKDEVFEGKKENHFPKI